MAPVNQPITSESNGHVLKFFPTTHRYYLDSKPVKGVTGIGDGYPKGDVLSDWTTGEGAKYAIQQANIYWKDNNKSLGVSTKDGKKVIEDSKSAYKAVTKKAANVGTTIHEYAYALQTGKTGLIVEATEKIRKHESKKLAAKAKQAVDTWWEGHTDEIVMSEAIGASVELQIAGTFDGLIKRKGKFGVRDYKTSKRIYIDHFQQCAGYGILIPEWYSVGPIDFFEIIHFSKDTGEVAIGLMDENGYWLNGQLIIGDSDIMSKMFEQFRRNLKTVKFMREFKDFWKIANG